MTRVNVLMGLMDALHASYERAGKPRRVLLGLSGGADSVGLFHMLRRLAQEEPFSFACAHVHHGLREAADQDEAFVRALCQTYQAPLQVVHVAVAKAGNLEENARLARHAALRQAAAQAGCALIALAHHAQDQAETMLMHAMRGSGLHGFAGMREVAGGIWRPLLQCRREDIRTMLVQLGQPWREDETNADAALLRNALRLQVLPVLERLSPGSAVRLARTARLMQDDDDALTAQAQDWLAENAAVFAPSAYLMREPFCQLSPALQRRALRQLAQQAGGALEAEDTLALQEMAAAPGSCRQRNLPGGYSALRTMTRLHMIGPAAPMVGSSLGTLACESGHTLVRQADSLTQTLDMQAVCGAVLRLRRAGDRIRPLGVNGSQSLKEYFIDHQVDRPLRGRIPLLARGGDILWAVGVGIAAPAAVGPQTRQAVTLRYVGRHVLYPGMI